MKNKKGDIKKYSKELSFFKLFLFFFFGSLIGSLLEEIIIFFSKGKWTRSHDLIYGPFSTLYGFGIVIYLILFAKGNKSRGVLKTFFLTAITGGIIEYLASLFLELFLNLKVWDYSDRILDIQGRTTIPIMIIWGIEATILLKIIYPFVSNLIDKVPYKATYPIYVFLLVFMIFNMTISYTAIFRMISRNKGNEPVTFIGKIYDKIYDDEFMKKKFPLFKEKT